MSTYKAVMKKRFFDNNQQVSNSVYYLLDNIWGRLEFLIWKKSRNNINLDLTLLRGENLRGH